MSDDNQDRVSVKSRTGLLMNFGGGANLLELQAPNRDSPIHSRGRIRNSISGNEGSDVGSQFGVGTEGQYQLGT